MANTNEEQEIYIVTEQGVFGDLDIKDPSKKKAKKKSEIDELIREANEKNLQNL